MTSEPPSPRPPPRTITLLLVLTAGFVSASTAAIAIRRPDLARAAVERVRFGTTSQGGMLLTIGPRGDGGAALRVRFANVSDTARAFMIGPGGDEFVVDVRDERGDAVPPAPRAVDALEEPRALEAVVIPAGAAVETSLSLAGLVPGPGRYRVRVERIPLEPDRLRLRSNEVVVNVK